MYPKQNVVNIQSQSRFMLVVMVTTVMAVCQSVGDVVKVVIMS